MAASEATDTFGEWLSDQLRRLNTDEGVFTSYIQGILEGQEDTREEKAEALQDILSEVAGADIDSLCQEILTKWSQTQSNGCHAGDSGTVSVDAKLAEIMEKQAKCIVAPKKYTEEQKQLREAILSQYGQLSDQEDEGRDGYEDEEEENVSGKEAALAAIGKNTNVDSVSKAEREKREKAKVDSQKKREKDKEDREKQKQQEQERKEKEKRRTQKGEKRRQ